MLAGTGTTATATERAMTELVRHPDTLSRSMEEINSVVGLDRLVKESDITELAIPSSGC
jgi:cytochrome P450